MTITRIKVRWTIPGAGTAYSILHFSDFGQEEPTGAQVTTLLGHVNNQFAKLLPIVPNQVKFRVEHDAEVINETTGQMIGIVSGTAQTEQGGGAGAAEGWAAAAGAVVSWSTSGVRNGRRVRGRTFIVPLSNIAWDVDGGLTVTAINAVNAFADGLRAGTAGNGVLGVWSRPSGPAATDGAWWAALAHRVPDMSAILRSRRS